MRLMELFDTTAMTVRQRLAQSALDMITPLLAQKVPFVTVKQMIEQLRKTKPGIFIDQPLVLDLLDPANCKAVEKIENDRIYLQNPQDASRMVGPDQQQSDDAAVHDDAVKTAEKAIQDS